MTDLLTRLSVDFTVLQLFNLLKIQIFFPQTLGSYYFDLGIDGFLVSYLDRIKDTPTVVSNLNLTVEPKLNKFLIEPTVFIINNTKVGIVECLTTDSPVISFCLLEILNSSKILEYTI